LIIFQVNFSYFITKKIARKMKNHGIIGLTRLFIHYINMNKYAEKGRQDDRNGQNCAALGDFSPAFREKQGRGDCAYRCAGGREEHHGQHGRAAMRCFRR
jgi:hypothetical protein